MQLPRGLELQSSYISDDVELGDIKREMKSEMQESSISSKFNLTHGKGKRKRKPRKKKGGNK